MISFSNASTRCADEPSKEKSPKNQSFKQLLEVLSLPYRYIAAFVDDAGCRPTTPTSTAVL